MKKRILLGKLLPLYVVVIIACLAVAYHGSRGVTTMVELTPVSSDRCYIIDAGHGGIDGGATSCSGKLESSINLEIALRLNDLMRFLGYSTKMIRTTDTSVYTEGTTIGAQKISDLKERVRIVNETENGILISIHQNTYSDGRYSGAQVFYAADDTSRGLAEGLQSLMVATINPGSNRRCKSSSGIYLMQNIRRPGVLIECGFLSNPEEDKLLSGQEYQKKLCCVIAAGLI